MGAAEAAARLRLNRGTQSRLHSSGKELKRTK
jgi:hypothetical protein